MTYRMGLGFRILRPVEVRADGVVVAPDGDRPLVVLAGLLTHAGQRVTVTQLTRWLWDDDRPLNARAAIQTYVSRLRRALGNTDVLQTEQGGYRLTAPDDAIDLIRFRSAAAQGWARSERGAHAEAVAAFDSALAEWSGEPLSNVVSEVLQRDVVAALHEEALAVREARADALLALGQTRRLISELTELAAGHPLHERVHEQLMLALYRAGRQADALAVFDRVRSALDEELGLVPGSGMQELRQAIITADPALDPPPAQVSAGKPSPPRRLPGDVGGFTDRDQEPARLRAQLPDVGGTAVAVLDGTAGVGTSALAVHFAYEVGGASRRAAVPGVDRVGPVSPAG
ncbi:AfsR/SARP family transcriptional regulator [Amycolatopsis sp. OK19-0408]|uniref:AfsR/SARP family transcriptional regulator n=1 Tax=Amycolatopsis iheyensis TaxID=2945988 RepID=A0A9X2NLL2_9PSEU|nr:AfsR/SARP family transcriptional regulator [Amycolatopsis iheyensis]MCR6489816.1 AfsR/SARP family transcriptional regulator [Amycolatopsis iheyensis]